MLCVVGRRGEGEAEMVAKLIGSGLQFLPPATSSTFLPPKLLPFPLPLHRSASNCPALAILHQPSPPPTPLSHQQQTLLDSLALDLQKQSPPSNPHSSTVRVLSWALKDVEDVSQVDAYLQNLHFPLSVFSSVIQKLGAWSKLQAAICVYRWLLTRPDEEERPNVFIYTSLLGVIKSCGDFELWKVVLEDMKKSKVEPTLVTYNIMIACFEQQGLHSEAVDAFQELEQKGLTPNPITYRALLRGYEKLGDMNGALYLYSSAKDVFQKTGQDDAVEGLREIVSGLSSRFIRNCLVEGKDPYYILYILQTAENSLAELRVRDYEEIMWSCGSQPKDHIIVKNVLARRKLSSLPVGVALCNHVMRVMGKGKKWWAALEVFEWMMEEGPPPDKDSYNIIRSQFNFLLNASRERGTCSWSLQLLEKMEAHGILPDRFAWDTALVTCAKKVDPEAAVLCFQKMIEQGQHPSILSYGALLSALEKGALFEKAEQVWEHMKRMDVKPNIEAYTTMVSVYAGSEKHEKLMALVDEIRASGVQFTLITYNALITASGKAGNVKAALNWMKELSAKGFHPDATTYSQLVKFLSQVGETELARDMCIKAKELNLVLSRSANDAMVEACRVLNVELDLDAVGGESCQTESDYRV